MNPIRSGAPSEIATEEQKENSFLCTKKPNNVEFRVINGNGIKTKIQYPEFGDRVRKIIDTDIEIINEPQSAEGAALIRALTEEDSDDIEERKYRLIRDKLVGILLDES